MSIQKFTWKTWTRFPSATFLWNSIVWHIGDYCSRLVNCKVYEVECGSDDIIRLRPGDNHALVVLCGHCGDACVKRSLITTIRVDFGMLIAIQHLWRPWAWIWLCDWGHLCWGHLMRLCIFWCIRLWWLLDDNELDRYSTYHRNRK